MKFAKLLLPVCAIAALVVGFNVTSAQETTTVELDILSGAITIGSDGAFDFGDYTVSASVQTVTGAFVAPGGYFFVDDLKGADSGYYTTVQLSGDMAGPGTSTIASSNVFMEVASTAVTVLSGDTNASVVVDNAMTSRQSLDAARTLIERDPGANNGTVGKYGTLPEMRVDIPAYQAVGNYTSTLVYTLYEN